MDELLWILAGGALMSVIALVGGLTTLLSRPALERMLLPLVAMAAGTLLGGAFFHMLPVGVERRGALAASTWLLGGFATFLALEQLLHWHHSHGESDPDAAAPVVWLVLLGDGLHNFLGGLAVASTFLLDARAGITAWVAAAAHEVPQELGDFGVLVHAGWSRRRALLWNLVSGAAFLVGALVAWAAAQELDVSVLALFGAGSFLYIGASDLVPEIKAHPSPARAAEHFAAFAAGLLAMLALAHLLG